MARTKYRVRKVTVQGVSHYRPQRRMMLLGLIPIWLTLGSTHCYHQYKTEAEARAHIRSCRRAEHRITILIIIR